MPRSHAHPMKNDADLVAAAVRTLEHMRRYLCASVPQERRAALFHELSQLPLEQLAAMTPVEAEHTLESLAEDGSSTRIENALVCASRGSALAMIQTRSVAAQLAVGGMATTILTITTTGDRVQDRSLAAIGTDSLFVKELERALRDGVANYAVHSCKDLPSTLPPDMQIAAVGKREDPRDAFCSENYSGFDSLPPEARVGTSSPRRRAQLAALRPDLTYLDVRGNVDTRLRKLREGQYDAIVLACAGLNRLKLRATHTVPFEVDRVVPAVAQGALAVETLASAGDLPARVRAAVNDESTELAVLCERAALRYLRGGCQAPVGIHARTEGEEMRVAGIVASIDGSALIRAEIGAPVRTAEESAALGERLGAVLAAKGAGPLLQRTNDTA